MPFSSLFPSLTCFVVSWYWWHFEQKTFSSKWRVSGWVYFWRQSINDTRGRSEGKRGGRGREEGEGGRGGVEGGERVGSCLMGGTVRGRGVSGILVWLREAKERERELRRKKGKKRKKRNHKSNIRAYFARRKHTNKCLFPYPFPHPLPSTPPLPSPLHLLNYVTTLVSSLKNRSTLSQGCPGIYLGVDQKQWRWIRNFYRRDPIAEYQKKSYERYNRTFPQAYL